MSTDHSADGPRGDWAYVSIVSVLPGLSLDVRLALLVQFLLFEGGAVVLSLWYGRLGVLPAATAAILVTTAGSGLMLALSQRIRALDPPSRYRELLFESSIDVLLGVVAFLLLLTYLLVEPWGPSAGFLERLIGEPLPVPMVFFALVILWDLCYRIGTGWWAGLTGLWRSLRLRDTIGTRARTAYARADALTVVFASLQLLLVPFLMADRLLAIALVGHVVAVLLVAAASIVVLRVD
ncbi:MAG: hypothetical protein R3324_03555 [Halobacteriales archaeon]|nr:hypothetical protein [Halobacteriales archaeon]